MHETQLPPCVFDPADPGTSDSQWRAALDDEPVLGLPPSAIVVVSPHPDDEVFGAGGLMCSAARCGRPVIVLSVTDGEAAYPDWSGLDAIRRRELTDALTVLAPNNVSLHHLSIPDGRVDEHRAVLSEALHRLTPPGSLLVSPYEGDGHPDHDATGEVCREFGRLRNAPVWRYPIWAWHHSAPEWFAGRAWGRHALDAATIGVKTRAIECFESQLRPADRKPIVPRHILSYFIRPYEAFLL